MTPTDYRRTGRLATSAPADAVAVWIAQFQQPAKVALRMYKSEKLDIEIRMLGRILGDVIREQAGVDLYDVEEDVRLTARARRMGDPEAESKLMSRIRAMTAGQARAVARAFTIFFELANLSEDRQRVRVLRERERNTAPRPRSESIGEVVELLKDEGFSPDQVRELLQSLSIELVFTAHPTEAKRRSVRVKVRRLREYLAQLDREGLLPREREHLLTEMRMYMTGLWQTDLLRARRPTVLEEVEVGLYFTSTLWAVIPDLYRDMRRALEQSYPGSEYRIPPFLQIGSWIGGDRDGNPYVTAEVTEHTLIMLRRAAVQAHLAQCARVFDSLSPSTKQVGVSDELRAALRDARRRFPETLEEIEPLSPYEDYRRYLKVIEWRLRRTLRIETVDDRPEGSYGSKGELLSDLELLAESLRRNQGTRILAGDLQDWLWQVETFGLHLAHLDIRQESTRNSEVVAELLGRMGLQRDYISLSDAERAEALTAASVGASSASTEVFDLEGLSDQCQEAVRLFRLIARVAKRFGPEALGGYVISMTHAVSDVLAVLWLLRFAGVSEDAAPIRIIPLFETIDDLSRAPEILAGIIGRPEYRAYLTRQGMVQTVMIGYSDSTKDGGYLSANWSLYKAQSTLYDKALEMGVRIKFFHGRGGSLGRGGGPAARSILSLPPQTVGPGLRMTEQGEVLAERYDDPQVAYRHLEQVVWATMMARARPLAAPRPEWIELLDELALAAYENYRSLVQAPGFLVYFLQATPIEEIETLPIASRPSRRHGERRLEDLRAIPWVFSWTQSRHLIPAWYGTGSAFERVAGARANGWKLLSEMYEEWAFFRATIDNAVLALSKSDMNIAFRYAELVEDRESRDRIWGMISAEFRRTREAVLRVNGRQELLAEVPWLQRSIQVRNPNTDPLNLIQIEWLRRLRKAEGGVSPDELEEIHSLIRLTIQGLAAGMRTTG